MYRHRNEVIQEELGVLNVTDKIAGFRRNCHYNVRRMDNDKKPVGALNRLIFPDHIEAGEELSEDRLNSYNLDPKRTTLV